jgi:hypothetical protein
MQSLNMTDIANPFQPPNSEDERPKLIKQANWRSAWMIAWPFIYGANMIVPIMVGRELIRDAGLLGVIFASVLLLALGWTLFVTWPALAIRLSLGSIFTALLQFFPILHFILGILAFGLAVELGQATDMNDQVMPSIDTEWGGFIVTLTMGFMLMLISTGFGILGMLIFRWRDK